ncbi:MAG: thioesterase, partial [Clostridiaceae bacterium]|nr:thioesterase [Clostridiaceae bacterium]
EKALSLPPAPKKILLPEQIWEADPVTVQRHHLDTNLHVNNAQYVAIARELLPGRFSIGELRAEYKKAAVLGDQMIPKIGKTPEGYVVSLQDPEGGIHANIWLAEKREDE